MKALHERGFPVPTPIAQNRHIVVMSLAPGVPMSQVRAGKMDDPGPVFLECAALITRLGQHGLVHCDFNEFNLMVDEHSKVGVGAEECARTTVPPSHSPPPPLRSPSSTSPKWSPSTTPTRASTSTAT